VLATEQAALTAATAKVSRRTWLATAIMLIAVFMELMDVTMTNVAVPSIRKDLGATAGQLQWIVAGYSLAFAVALMTGGRLGDIWGRKKAFLTGLVAFTGASLLSGAAPSAGFLIGSRVLQGLAADLSHQHPDRRRRVHRRAEAGQRVNRARAAQARPGRSSHRRTRHVPAGLPGHRRPG